MRHCFLLFAFALVYSCSSPQKEKSKPNTPEPQPVATSLSGQPFYAAAPSAVLQEKLKEHQSNFETDPEDVDKHIWYGRFIAYTADYPKALDFYTQSIKKFPNDPRLYRHRGHRYISTRQFDKAIADFKKAEQLILGTENEIEPDGMPNEFNIPVSTLHGNIYYHLGLAHYLKNDMENALTAFLKCKSSTQNDDNVVSSTHWIYMILRRLDREKETQKYLADVQVKMKVLENFSYYQLCLFYKGLLSETELKQSIDLNSPSGDAIKYGLANWYFYNNQKGKAKEWLAQIVSSNSWNSFGYIAAEADLFYHYSN